MPTTRVLLVVTAILGTGALLWGAPRTSSETEAARGQKVQLGVLGDARRFARITGQRSTVLHSFIGWNQPQTIRKLLAQLRPVPMLAIKTGGIVTPLDIAQGRGDAFLIELNHAIADFHAVVYVRPMPEMNGHWNEYSAFNTDGSSRGQRYSTAAFRKAFARIALIARGGPAQLLDARLRRLGLPGVGQADLPTAQARIVWNPQGYGAPDIPANAPQAYYPGDAYVDVVANDLYDQGFKAAWDANEKLYSAHRNKPFAIAEWGLWGIDDPPYVERMASFVRSHSRIELISYFSSKPGSIWDLSTKPRSRAAYRRVITPLGG
jgi:hypothetical protein